MTQPIDTAQIRKLRELACSDYVPWTKMSKPESDYISALLLAAPALLNAADERDRLREKVRNAERAAAEMYTATVGAMKDENAALRTRLEQVAGERNRLQQTVEYFSTIGGHGYMLPIGSPFAAERQMTATEVVHRVANAALRTLLSSPEPTEGKR